MLNTEKGNTTGCAHRWHPCPQSNSAKYLGVILDRKLTLSKQVSVMRVRVSAHVSVIAPIMACDSQIRRIQAAQNEIARMITGCDYPLSSRQ